MPPLGCVTGQGGTSSDHAGNQKERQMEDGQQHCEVRIIGRLAQIQSYLNKSQTKYFEAADSALEELIFGKHRAEDVLRPFLMEGACSYIFFRMIVWAVQPNVSECELLSGN